MDQQTVPKTYKYQLVPTPTQERELRRLFGLCRRLYNTALGQRIIAWQRCRVSLLQHQQAPELTDIRTPMPKRAAVHTYVLQDVLARLEKMCQAFFRRVKAGKKAGFPHYQARTRWHAFTEEGRESPVIHGGDESPPAP
jgi:putative transposase